MYRLTLSSSIQSKVFGGNALIIYFCASVCGEYLLVRNFLGYLMRSAYELGYSNAVVFTRGILRFLSLDEITFKHPVPIGSILRLKSRTAHTVPESGLVVSRS